MNEAEQLLRDVATGGERRRIELSTEPGLPEVVYRALLELDDPDINAGLAMNSDIPPSILDALAAQGGPLADFVRENYNASPDLKDDSPIGNQSDYSLERYLEDRGATHEQSIAFFAEAHRIGFGNGGPLVREVWASITNY